MITVNRSQLKPQKHKINDDILEIVPLGAGSEVGRSSILLKYKGKQVLFDCGVHPAFKGISSLPFFDLCRPEEVDLVLISHFHLDHCGAIPHFLEHTQYKGSCYMTHPTKAIVSLLLKDFVRVSDDNQTLEMADKLFSEEDLHSIDTRVIGIDYRQEKKVNGIKFWCYNAGHVLGAAMFMVEIAGVHVLYTGDYSPCPDRHLVGAEIPTLTPDILLVESTYGTGVHENREKREIRFRRMVKQIVERGGKCLIPVFALGRAQELLLILDEMWSKTDSLLHNVPIYYASSLAEKCMSVFRTYSNTMNDEVRNQIDYYNRNPFIFKHIKKLRRASEVKNKMGSCVVLASPGMLQSGLSRELYEAWCKDPRNGVVITGYCVEDTPARIIQNEPDTVILSSGEETDFRMTVNTISFSAHSDRKMTETFIEKISPDYVVLIHGSSKSVKKLRGSLISKFPKTPVYHPRNGDRVRIEFKREKVGKMIGSLAQKFRNENMQWRKKFGKFEEGEEEEANKNNEIVISKMEISEIPNINEEEANLNEIKFENSEISESEEEEEDAFEIEKKSMTNNINSNDKMEDEIKKFPEPVEQNPFFEEPKQPKKLSWKELMERTKKKKMNEQQTNSENDQKSMSTQNNKNLGGSSSGKRNVEHEKMEDEGKFEDSEAFLNSEFEEIDILQSEKTSEQEDESETENDDIDVDDNNLMKDENDEEISSILSSKKTAYLKEMERKKLEESEKLNSPYYLDYDTPKEKKRRRNISGIWINKDFQTHLIDPIDLKKYFDIPLSGVSQKLILTYPDHTPNPWNFSDENLFYEYWNSKLSELVNFKFYCINPPEINNNNNNDDENNNNDENEKSKNVISKLEKYLIYSIDFKYFLESENTTAGSNNFKIFLRIEKMKPGILEISWNSSKTLDFIIDYFTLELLNYSILKEKSLEEDSKKELLDTWNRRKKIFDDSKNDMKNNDFSILEKLKEVLEEMFYEGEDSQTVTIHQENEVLEILENNRVILKINKFGFFLGECLLVKEEKLRIRKVIDNVFLCFDPLYKIKANIK